MPVTEWIPEARVSFKVAAFDDLDTARIAAAPVTYMDGRHDTWWTPPKEIRHL